jgi:hypothetical protein
VSTRSRTTCVSVLLVVLGGVGCTPTHGWSIALSAGNTHPWLGLTIDVTPSYPVPPVGQVPPPEPIASGIGGEAATSPPPSKPFPGDADRL